MAVRLASALLLVASLGWAQSVYVPVEAINQARADRGLSPVVRDSVLDTEAQDFLWYNLQVPEISHDAAGPDGDILHEMYAEIFSNETGLSPDKFSMYELLASGEGPVAPSHIVHEFDGSPYHAEVYYDPDLRYVGYVLFFMGDRWIYVFYAVVVKGAEKQLGQADGLHQG